MSEPKAIPEGALRRLVWPMRLTQAGMVAERVTRGFWPVWTILFAIIAALAFGLHDWLPVEILWIGSLVVLCGLVWSLWRGIRQFRWPTRGEALARLDAHLPGRPIAALTDAQALGADDAGSLAVWRAHVARMTERATKARATMPDLRLATRDPFALRYAALTALVIAAVFGSLWRIADAPKVAAGGIPGDGADAGPTWEGWAEPPGYTGKPSIYLNTVDASDLSLPEGSRIILRLYGAPGEIAATETVSGKPPADAAATSPDLSVQAIEFEAVRSGTLSISGPDGREWALTVLADAAPTVSIEGSMSREADGTMSQPFAAKDDYAVTAGRALIELDLATLDRRYGLAAEPEPRDPITFDLPLPITGSRADFAETLVEDASKHAWSNLPVRMTFEVTDGRGQTGRSETVELALPGRRFFDPVANAVAELRRDLLWTRGNGVRTAQLLHAITHRPEGLVRSERAYLMLRVAMRRLDAALAQGPLSADLRDETAEALWEIALLIEDGGLADALERMQQAQERLSEAIRNGASPEEIQKLMDELRQATNDYIRQLAENMERKGADEPSQQADAGQQITGDQLQQMMDEIQRLMEEGRMAEAQELLDQLSRMMENLQVTEGQGGQQGQQGPGEQAMNGLRDTLRQQQGLSDETFRGLQEQFGQPQGGQPGQQQPGQGGSEFGQQQDGQGGQPGQSQPGQQNGQRRLGEEGGQNPDGQSGQQGGSLADRQKSLRETLREQEGAMPGTGSPEGDAARQALEDAGRAMDGAEDALRRGDTSEAIDRQAEAIENLREGMRNLGQALAQSQQGEAGEQGQTTREANREMPRDPLGRTTGQSGRIGTDDNLMQGEDVYRRARNLLDEIRRRSGDQERPTIELDYLRRLLERF
ncbi:MAG: TIGR02302 family protein [Albidovulum sp.]